MNLPNIPKMPNIPNWATSGLAFVMMLFGGMSGAMAHSGHLGEFAGHGHLIGAALGVAAAVLAAALVAKGRAQTADDEENAETVTDNENEGEFADA